MTKQTGTAPTAPACNGDMVYSFTYTDCATRSHVWTYTYHIVIPDFTLPANADTTVNCAAAAVAPTPPVVKDTCGNVLFFHAGTAPTVSACNGVVVFCFIYTDCATRSHVWTYTY